MKDAEMLKLCEWCKQPPETWSKPGEPHTAAVRCVNTRCPVRSAGWVSPGFWNSRVPVDSTAPGVDDLKLVIEGVIRQHHTARTHQPTYCCPEDESVYDRLLVRMLMEKLAAASPASKDGEAHRCPHCGRRMQSDFDEDVGFWYECANCDYREAVSSTVTAAKPSGAAREAAEEIAAYVSDGILGMGNEVTETNAAKFHEIISRHFSTAAESVGQGWQPIETAPKDDGPAFLVWCPLSMSGNVYHVFRYPNDDHFRIYGSGGRLLYETATHWMPLPPAPVVSDGDPED